MNAAFYRLKDGIFLGIVFAAFMCSAVTYLPNYQRYAYDKTPYVKYDKYDQRIAGYPALEEGFPMVNSVQDVMDNKKYNFLLKIDMKDLKPINRYYGIKSKYIYTSNFRRNIENNQEGGVCQFFVAKLNSGESVMVLIDDTTFRLPESGMVTLPVARYRSANLTSWFEKPDEISNDNFKWYIDTAGCWREGKEASKAETVRNIIMVISFLGSLLIWLVLYKKLVGHY